MERSYGGPAGVRRRAPRAALRVRRRLGRGAARRLRHRRRHVRPGQARRRDKHRLHALQLRVGRRLPCRRAAGERRRVAGRRGLVRGGGPRPRGRLRPPAVPRGRRRGGGGAGRGGGGAAGRRGGRGRGERGRGPRDARGAAGVHVLGPHGRELGLLHTAELAAAVPLQAVLPGGPLRARRRRALGDDCPLHPRGGRRGRAAERRGVGKGGRPPGDVRRGNPRASSEHAPAAIGEQRSSRYRPAVHHPRPAGLQRVGLPRLRAGRGARGGGSGAGPHQHAGGAHRARGQRRRWEGAGRHGLLQPHILHHGCRVRLVLRSVHRVPQGHGHTACQGELAGRACS
mmetsp:Transcript_10250/g.35685  ORF Transcript_10250/g.35685 Transcript_10250/m.35685 type:complete len:342 (+) Transcript_10250:445-1470(+)